MYQLSIIETALTESGVRVPFAAGTDDTGRSIAVAFDIYAPSTEPVSLRYLPDVPAVDGGAPIPGWQTYIKTLTGAGDYLCDPPVEVPELTGDAIYSALSDWLRHHVY